MPLSLLIGALTLVPALAAIVTAGLGAARRALAPAVFVLCAVGTLAPVICLLILAPYLGTGEPLRVTLFGGSLAAGAWFSAVYRADALGVYAGLGLTVLVVPLLLWMAWKGRLAPAAPNKAVAERDSAEPETPTDEAGVPATPSTLPLRSWAGVALTLAVESAALTVLFADNILWLALAWLVLSALVWGLGELDAEAIDRVGIGLALAGPVAWAIVMLTGAVGAKSPTLFDLMGRGAYEPVRVILLALVVALAGGAYPFLAWVRRRATLATPAGLGALLMVALPVVLFVAARTYGAATDANGQWAEIGKAAPPIYGGIAWAVLGTVTVGVCGLLALERRDNRTLLAYLAVAQVGWGMLALSTGEPASLAGIVLLLAGGVLGLGAMLLASFAGAILTDDEEPDGAGPRAFGTRFSPTGLFAWSVGAVSLLGVPLFGGFAARELISAAALHLGNLTVPLMAVAWAGDALLALALIRATAPAFTQLVSGSEDGDEDEEETLAAIAISTKQGAGEGMDAADDEDVMDEVDDEDEDDASVKPGRSARRKTSADIRALPALIFALLAVALGIVPQVLLDFGGTLAAGTLAPAHAVDEALRSTQIGYATGFGQWLPGIAWGALVLLALVFTFTRPDSLRVERMPSVGSQAAVTDDEAQALELAGQREPFETWRELTGAFVSPFTIPAGAWLLAEGEEEPGSEAEETPGEAEPAAVKKAAKETETQEPASAEPAAVVVTAKAAKSAPPKAAASQVGASGEISGASGGAKPDDNAPSPARTLKASQPATKPVAKSPTSGQPATPEANPAKPAAKTPAKAAESTTRVGGTTTKPAAGGTRAAKPATPATGPKPGAAGKSSAKSSKPAKPTGGAGSAPNMAKGGKPGGKKQPGNRA